MRSNINRILDKEYENKEKISKDVADLTSKQKVEIPVETLSLNKSKINFLSKIAIRIKEFVKKHDVDFKYLLYAIPIIAIFLIAQGVQTYKSWFTKAGTNTVNVSFQLSSWSLPPENNFEIWLSPNNPVGFADIEIQFNPNLVKLTKEIVLKDRLTKVIKVSTMAEANSTGKISIILGLDPSQINNPPKDPFQVATVSFNSNTSDQNVSTEISFDNDSTQIVALDTTVFTITSSNLNLNINPTPTPIATTSPTESPSTSKEPSATPDSNVVLTESPTPSPEATSSIAPTPSPTASSATETNQSNTTSTSTSSNTSSNSPNTSSKNGDINNDNVVDIRDLSILLSNWNKNTSTGDINHDNIVNINDLSLLLSNWNK
jgi:hypothetical protein